MKPSIGQSGIYQIRHLESGKVYVGSASVCILGRWKKHLYDLGRGKHHSILLQRAWNKYGPDAFAWEIILLCSGVDCLKHEQTEIDRIMPTNPLHGYNIASNATRPMFGRKHTAAAKELVRKANLGKVFSAETLLKISRANTNPSAEIRRKRIAAMMGRNVSPETRLKISIAARNISDETRQKMSASAKRRMHTVKSRSKISAAGKARMLMPENREKLSKALAGKPWTEKRRAAETLRQNKERT